MCDEDGSRRRNCFGDFAMRLAVAFWLRLACEDEHAATLDAEAGSPNLQGTTDGDEPPASERGRNISVSY